MPAACPRCGHAPAGDEACARCGVVFARLEEPRRRSGDHPPGRPPEPHGGRDRRAVVLGPPDEARTGLHSTHVAWLVVVAVGLGVAVTETVKRSRRAAPPPGTAAPVFPAEAGPAPAAIPPPAMTALDRPPVLPDAAVETGGMSAEDRAVVGRVADALREPRVPGPADLDALARLVPAHPDDRGLRDLAVAALVAAANGDRRARQFAGAMARLRQAAELSPSSVVPWLGLLQVALDAGDWPGAEEAARSALSLDARSPDALRGLGYALLRQDRNREAEEVLRQAAEIGGHDAATTALLARVRKAMSDERGMTERNLAHFHVRYDGGAHEAVGREILRALERHYATLSSALGHQPASTIPVILFTRNAYYDASGAPAWSGGVYDSLDGRIRIPVGGLDASLTPDMDETLIHELTHAFVADMTRGVAPRDVHEGLAQYMEGKRVAAMLGPDHLRALAEGRLPGVGGFYAAALAFVEYLLGSRGMGGITDLLRQMGETGDVDAAFRAVYGSSHAETQRAFAVRLRQQHGS